METPSSSLPAAVKSRDDKFLESIQDHLTNELKKLQGFDCTSEDVFLVYSEVFARVIAHVTKTKGVLSRVKFEYDRCVEFLKGATKESAYLTGHLKAKAAEPATRRNYRVRIADLEEKIKLIKDDNRRIQTELLELREKRGKEHQRLKLERENANSSQEFTDTDLAPGLTLDQATDLRQLTAKSYELESTIAHLKDLQQGSYQLRTTKEKTKEALIEKIAAIDDLKKSILETRARKWKLRLAAEAAEAFIMAPPVGMTIGEYVISAMKGAKSTLQTPANVNLDQMDILNDLSGDREGSAAIIHDEKEAEALMEYLQQFTLLFDSGKYAEAATCAANSPKGILRNFETLTKFKQVSQGWRSSADEVSSARASKGRRDKDGGEKASPILLFCQSLLVAVGLGTPKLDCRMSLECVKVALEERRLELVTHWIAQDKLALSGEPGHLLLSYALKAEDSFSSPLELVALAQHVFFSVDDHRMTAACLMMQGLNHAFVNLCKTDEAQFSLSDYRRFFAFACEIAASLSRLPTTSHLRLRVFLANAAFTLVAPDQGLPVVDGGGEKSLGSLLPSAVTATTSTITAATAAAAAAEEEDEEVDKKNNVDQEVNDQDEAMANCGSHSAEATTTPPPLPPPPPLTLSQVVTPLFRAGWRDSVLKLLLKLEKDFGSRRIGGMIAAEEVVGGGDSDRAAVGEIEVPAVVAADWEVVAEAMRNFGYVQLAKTIEESAAVVVAENGQT